jgi:lysophospholipase L1-like esterase
MLPDGIHPNAKAQPQLAQIMKLEFDKLVKN